MLTGPPLHYQARLCIELAAAEGAEHTGASLCCQQRRTAAEMGHVMPRKAGAVTSGKSGVPPPTPAGCLGSPVQAVALSGF